MMTMMMMATQGEEYSARPLRSIVTFVNAPDTLMLEIKNAMHSFGLRSTWCRHLICFEDA